ncbi:MAG: 2-oxo acid dehydrogenase subunit E2 [Alphaproteobacteria bacterium]|nr:2-oxo acid dehydrogenase subunit E2 [Alphaproteobacteria bacterium]
MSIFRLPDLGEGLHEAEIVAWHVAAGDHVVADQPLVAIETGKAVVDVPSPQSGHIRTLLAEAGAEITVGDALVEFEEGAHADTGAVVGELARAAEAPKPTPALAAARMAARASGAARAMPAVRALARRLGVDLAGLAGSGPGGAITLADVERAAQPDAPKAVPSPALPGAEPLTRARRAMAINMARAGAEVVPASVSDEADVEGWIGRPGADPTIRLIRAVLAGAAAAPSLNAWFDGARLARVLHRQVDLGLAMELPDGLFVPVIRDAGARDAAGQRAEIGRLRAAVAARSAGPEDLRAPTITLSNFGMLGGRFAVMALLAPQVAILGAGRIAPRLVPTPDGPAARRLMPLSLTFDHRAATGGEAAAFLAAVIADLQRPD